MIIETDKWWCNCCTVLIRESWRLVPHWTLIIETDKWWYNWCTVNKGIIKISPFWTLLFQNLNDCLVFPFLVFAIYGNIFLLKYSGYFVWDLHTLLDRGNLCHSDVWYILCCLLRVFVSTVTWDFCAALLYLVLVS